MATQSQALTDDTPVDLVDALSLATGETYLIQVVGLAGIYLAEAAAAPDPGDAAHVLQAAETWSVTVGADGLWAWTTGGDGTVVVTEG